MHIFSLVSTFVYLLRFSIEFKAIMHIAKRPIDGVIAISDASVRT